MFSFRTVSAVSILGLLVTIAGCSGAAESNSGADTTGTVKAQDTVAAQDGGGRFGKGGPRHGGPGGGDMLVMTALHDSTVNLTADQKTTIETALKADRPAPPDGTAWKARSTALAAGIRSGTIDPSLVTPPKPDFTAMQANKAKLLTTLHDTLTADQRQALVTAVQTREADHKGKDGDHKRGPDGERGAKGGPHEGGPMGGLLKDLNLTQAQKDQIKTKLEADRPAKPTDAEIAQFKAQHEAMKAQMDAKLQTFAGASFDANAFVTPPAGAKPPQAEGHADHFAKELQVIVSVLDGTQREALAKKIEAGPPAHPAPPAQQ